MQVGSASSETATLAAGPLRSSGIEIVGSGLGSSSPADLVAGIGAFLRVFARARFQIPTEVRPLLDVTSAWDDPVPDRRLVFSIP